MTHVNAYKMEVSEKLNAVRDALAEAETAYNAFLRKLEGEPSVGSSEGDRKQLGDDPEVTNKEGKATANE